MGKLDEVMEEANSLYRRRKADAGRTVSYDDKIESVQVKAAIEALVEHIQDELTAFRERYDWGRE